MTQTTCLASGPSRWRTRSLLALLPRCAFAALRRHLRERAGRKDASPGFVASIQTFGARLPFHPHVHALSTDGLFARDGTFVAVEPDRPAHEPQFKGLRVRFFDQQQEFAPPMDFDDAKIDLVGLPEATYRAILSHPSLVRPIVRDNIVLRRGTPVEVEMR